MRFIGFTFFAMLTISATSVWAQPSSFQTAVDARESTSVDLGSPSKKKSTVRLRTGKSVHTLTAGDGLSLKPLSQGLGAVSALAMDEKGTLYVADRAAGRVWRLPERNQDGRFDSKQALPQRFDTPSGLTVSGQTVFVADRNAIWKIEGVHPPVKLAGLLQANSKGKHHPLSVSADGKSLYLGLTTTLGEAQILSVDSQTGAATFLQTAQSDQDIIALAAIGKGPPWVALEHGVGPSLENIIEFNSSQTIAALALPLRSSEWPEALNTHVIVSRLSADGYDVLALPAGLGKVESMGKTLFSGFLSGSGRSAWGVPGALYFDEKGLIVADSENGDLYRLSAAPALREKESDPFAANSEDQATDTDLLETSSEPPKMKVSTITEGSQIGSVSTLNRGSSLDVGSTIIRDYEPISLDKEEADKDDDPEGKQSAPQQKTKEK